MKYFMLKTSYVDDHIRKVYSDLAKTLENGGAKVLNPLSDKWENHLKSTYDNYINDWHYCFDKPDYETYCLLRNLQSISIHDCLISPARIITPSEIAQYNLALAAGLLIKDIEL